MKKRDLLLIISILTIAVSMLIGYVLLIKRQGAQVEIIVDGVTTQRLSLDQEADLMIQGENGRTNYLIIKGGNAKIVDASCPDKLCVYQKQIHYNGETIVCLPNKVVIKAISEKNPSLDAVVN